MNTKTPAVAQRVGYVQVLHTGLAKERSPLQPLLNRFLTNAIGLTLAGTREANGLQRSAFDPASHGGVIDAQRLGHFVNGEQFGHPLSLLLIKSVFSLGTSQELPSSQKG